MITARVTPSGLFSNTHFELLARTTHELSANFSFLPSTVMFASDFHCQRKISQLSSLIGKSPAPYQVTVVCLLPLRWCMTSGSPLCNLRLLFAKYCSTLTGLSVVVTLSSAYGAPPGSESIVIAMLFRASCDFELTVGRRLRLVLVRVEELVDQRHQLRSQVLAVEVSFPQRNGRVADVKAQSVSLMLESFSLDHC